MFLDVRLSETKCLFRRTAVKQPFTHYGNSHKRMCLRSHRVGNKLRQFLHRVYHHPRFRVVQFQMQVRPRRVTGIAAESYQVATFHGQLVRSISEIQCVAPSRAFKQLFIFVGKTLQMAIHARQPVRMVHVDGIAEAVLVNGNAADITVGNGENLLALLIVCLHVYSSVEMPRTRLTEVSCQHDVVIHRRLILNVEH